MSISERRVDAPARLTLSGRARDVGFGSETLVVDLEDGRQIVVPLAWFPRLAAAASGQRSNWELVGRGIGISWPDLDEDISVENLLGAGGKLLMDRAAPDEPAPQAQPLVNKGEVRRPRTRPSINLKTGRPESPASPAPPTR